MAATLEELKSIMEAAGAEARRERERDLQWRGGMSATVDRIANENMALATRLTKLETVVPEVDRRVRRIGDSQADHEGHVLGEVTRIQGILKDQDTASVAQRFTVDAVKTDVATLKTETRAQTAIIADSHTAIVRILAVTSTMKWLLVGVPACAAALWFLFSALHPVAPPVVVHDLAPPVASSSAPHDWKAAQ